MTNKRLAQRKIPRFNQIELSPTKDKTSDLASKNTPIQSINQVSLTIHKIFLSKMFQEDVISIQAIYKNETICDIKKQVQKDKYVNTEYRMKIPLQKGFSNRELNQVNIFVANIKNPTKPIHTQRINVVDMILQEQSNKKVAFFFQDNQQANQDFIQLSLQVDEYLKQQVLSDFKDNNIEMLSQFSFQTPIKQQKSQNNSANKSYHSFNKKSRYKNNSFEAIQYKRKYQQLKAERWNLQNSAQNYLIEKQRALQQLYIIKKQNIDLKVQISDKQQKMRSYEQTLVREIQQHSRSSINKLFQVSKLLDKFVYVLEKKVDKQIIQQKVAFKNQRIMNPVTENQNMLTLNLSQTIDLIKEISKQVVQKRNNFNDISPIFINQINKSQEKQLRQQIKQNNKQIFQLQQRIIDITKQKESLLCQNQQQKIKRLRTSSQIVRLKDQVRQKYENVQIEKRRTFNEYKRQFSIQKFNRLISENSNLQAQINKLRSSYKQKLQQYQRKIIELQKQKDQLKVRLSENFNSNIKPEQSQACNKNSQYCPKQDSSHKKIGYDISEDNRFMAEITQKINNRRKTGLSRHKYSQQKISSDVDYIINTSRSSLSKNQMAHPFKSEKTDIFGGYSSVRNRQWPRKVQSFYQKTMFCQIKNQNYACNKQAKETTIKDDWNHIKQPVFSKLRN